MVEQHCACAVASRHHPLRPAEQLSPAVVQPTLLPSGLKDDRRVNVLDQRCCGWLEAAMMRELKHMDPFEHRLPRREHERAASSGKVACHQQRQRARINTHHQTAIIRIERRIIG